MDFANLEHAVKGNQRSLPKWILDRIEKELIEARSIACPRARRIREIEIDLKKDALENEIVRGEPCP
jgi:hypothetical protein